MVLYLRNIRYPVSTKSLPRNSGKPFGRRCLVLTIATAMNAHVSSNRVLIRLSISLHLYNISSIVSPDSITRTSSTPSSCSKISYESNLECPAKPYPQDTLQNFAHFEEVNVPLNPSNRLLSIFSCLPFNTRP